MQRSIKAMEEKYLLPARKLIPGGLQGIRGVVSYHDYQTLTC